MFPKNHKTVPKIMISSSLADVEERADPEAQRDTRSVVTCYALVCST